MNKIKVGFVIIVVFCIVFLILSLTHFGATDVIWKNRTADGQLPWALWIELVKVITPLFAGLILLYQGFSGNVLSTVRSTVKIIGFGVLGIAIGSALEVYSRAILTMDTIAFGYHTIFFVLGAILVVWALFDFPAKLGARLKSSQRPWFFASVITATVVTIAILVYSSLQATDMFNVISQALYAIFTLAIFAGALRCTMVFAEGRIGRPFLFIAIGGLSIFTYVYYIWLPYSPNVTTSSFIHTLWIFCFLITALGAFDLTLSDVVN